MGLIDKFLKLYEDSESPREYLRWALITAISAVLGNNCALRLGHIKVKANLYTVLLGYAGQRKSTALTLVQRLLEGTSVNFAPTDTGGQRHGLMSALQGARLNPDLQAIKDHAGDQQFPLYKPHLFQRKPNDMLVLASELGRLFGTANREILDFLVDIYDNAEIHYRTKTSTVILHDSLCTILGATTPSSFAAILPDSAAGHGLLSRMLFIFADKNHKSVPLPKAQTPAWEAEHAELQNIIRQIDSFREDFTISKKATRLYEIYYPYVPEILDPRMSQYKERRAIHLLKIAMTLSAMRLDSTIRERDIAEAHRMLKRVEPKMHRALEVFGRNRAIVGRVMMLNYLRDLGDEGVATQAELLASAASELKRAEAIDALDSLIANREIVQHGMHFMLATAKNAVIDSKVINLSRA